MTDRLTPGMRAQILRLVAPYLVNDTLFHAQAEAERIEAEAFREEAARREAEASNPCKDPGACEVGGCLSPSACQAAAGEREGPGSAAAPTEPVICTVCLMPAKWGDECRSFPCPYPKRPVEDKPNG